MKPSVFLIHLFLLLSIVACGGKKSSTKTSLVLGGLIQSIAGQSGGTMIYGRQLSGGQDNFAIKLPYSEDLILANGFWRFAVVAWDGNDGLGGTAPMQGDVRCGLNEVNLQGGDQTVSMTLSQANCFAQFFGDDKSKEVSGQPKRFMPATCSLLDEKRGSIDNGQCKNSVGTAFTVELPQKLPGSGYSQGIVSACFSETTAADEFLYNTNANIRIPMFFPLGFNEPMIKLTVYEDSGCTQDPQETIISNPLAGTGSRSIELDSDVGAYLGTNVLYVHNPVCEGSFASGAVPFDIDGGDFGPDYILCNPNQFTWIQGNDLTGNYFLDSDLDYLAAGVITSPIITSPFTGSFDGRGHTIFDLDMDNSGLSGFGMFADISGRVSNLNFDGAFLDVSADRGDVGVLAGKLSGGGIIENIDLFDINITLSGSSAGAQVGALVGRVNNTAPNGGVRNITAEAITLDAVGYKDFGAIIGLIDGVNSRVNDISVDYVDLTFDNVAGPCVGGVFGVAKNSASVENISMVNLYIGDSVNLSGGNLRDNIGGIAGCVVKGSQLKSARITDAFIYTDSNAVGGVVGFADPISGNAASVTIKDVLSSVDIIEGNTKIGGVVGEAQGSAGNVLNLERSRYIGPSGSGYIECADKCAGLVGSLGGAGAIHTVTESWVRDLDIETTGASATIIGGLVATGQDAVLNSVFGDNITLTTTVNSHQVGGLYGSSSGIFSITNAYFKGDIFGENSGDNGLITTNAMNANLVNIYTIGNASKGSYGIGTPTTASATNIFTTISASPNATTATQATIEDSSTLWSGGFPATTWTNIQSSGSKELIVEKPYVLFANTGLGTKNDPYLISSTSAWNAIGDEFNFMGKAFKLTANLDFNASVFVPIGSVTNPFWGNLSGNNYSISNINEISCTSGAYGIIGQMSTVIAAATFPRDVGVNTDPNDGYLYLYDNTFNCTTAAVGSLVGKVEDSIAGGATDVDNPSFGIKIHNILVDGADVSATTGYVGGLVGVSNQNNTGTSVRNIIVSNSLIDGGSTTPSIGGIFGKLESTGATPTIQGRVVSLKSINNIITAINAATATGGIFGVFSAKHLEVRKMITNSDVNGLNNVGGVVGLQSDGRIAEAVSKGDVSGDTNVGGFVGNMNLAATVISGSYSTASVTATTNGSGFAGSIIASATIKNSWYEPDFLAGAATLSPSSNITGAGSNLVLVGSDTVRTGLTQTTVAQIQNDTAFFGTNFIGLEPFVFVAGDYPRPYFVVWPQFFNE